MSLDSRGYMNKILRVNLTTGELSTQALNKKVMRLILGGKGLGAWILYNDLEPKIDPLSPENLLMFVVGPLTGTSAPTAGRLGVVTKSPATGTFLDSYCGGFFGETLKYAGYDAVIIKGKAPKLTVLVIDDHQIRLDDGSPLWGLSTMEATKKLKSTYGEEFRTAVTGPAGERLVPIAGIFCDLRTAGRGGAGAVMGSKNLKGVVVRGTGSVEVADRKEFDEAVWVAHRMLRMSSQIRRMKTDGTVNILELINVGGALPTRNFQSGQFDQAEKIWSERWREELWKESVACYGCPIACTKIAFSKQRDIRVDGPEYETVFALGSNCGVTDKEAIIYANYLCDLYGVDTISVGGIIAFVMELYQRKMISSQELDGVKAQWGSGEALVQLTEKIGKGEGIGELLQKGVREISKHFPGSQDFAMEVKGLELPGYLPRGAKGIALSYAISERGACHLRGCPLTELLGGADPLTTDGKALLFKTTQSDTAVVDACILCYFTKFGFTLKEIFQMVNPCTGFEYKNPRELEKVGERLTTLARLFNVREGFSKEDDYLPKRCLSEPLPSGPARGHVVELEEMRSEYYKLMGWDENGIPEERTLEKLGLREILNNQREVFKNESFRIYI